MDWLIGLLLLIAGIIIGFFVGKYLFEPKQQTNAAEEQEKSEKQLLADQANIHIEEVQSLLDGFQQHCARMAEQVEHYKAIIEETNQEKTTNNLEYYNQQASLHLRTKKTDRSKKSSKSDYQPLDYSEGSSGLFVGDKNKHSETSHS